MLDLADQVARADGVDSTCRNEKDISRMGWAEIQDVFEGVVFKLLPDFFLRGVLFETDIEACTRFRVDDVPHLVLAVFVLMFEGVIIARVDLDG